MSGSGASNLGYGNIAPLNNINNNYVNVSNTNNPYSFGSNEIPGLPGLAGTKNNIDAAAGKAPCLFKGGAKKIKKKIKNITKNYKKMGRKSRKMTSLKNRLKKMFSKSKKNSRKFLGNKRRKHRSHKQKGGYSQYQNNLPLTHSYSVGGILGPNNIELANPPPINVYKGAGQCVDNYNHYTNKGFPSPGH